MSYNKAMKHHCNPRKWKPFCVRDGSRGMSQTGRRANALIFGTPIVASNPQTSAANTVQT